eukprot:1386502-Pyramimonas_sp.AAC.1
MCVLALRTTAGVPSALNLPTNSSFDRHSPHPFACLTPHSPSDLEAGVESRVRTQERQIRKLRIRTARRINGHRAMRIKYTFQ